MYLSRRAVRSHSYVVQPRSSGANLDTDRIHFGILSWYPTWLMLFRSPSDGRLLASSSVRLFRRIRIKPWQCFLRLQCMFAHARSVPAVAIAWQAYEGISPETFTPSGTTLALPLATQTSVADSSWAVEGMDRRITFRAFCMPFNPNPVLAPRQQAVSWSRRCISSISGRRRTNNYIQGFSRKWSTQGQAISECLEVFWCIFRNLCLFSSI